MKRFFLLFIVLLFLFNGCKSDEQKVSSILAGCWYIDSWVYKDIDLRGCMAMNNILFYDDSIVAIPTTILCDSSEYKDINWKGVYKVFYKDKNTISLVVATENKFLKDTIEINFIDDTEDKLMRMKLRSKNTYVLCTKGILIDYLQFKGEINEIANVKHEHLNRN